MVNKDRIVPIQKIDYLSMIGTILTIANVSYALVSDGIEGAFDITGSGAAGTKLLNQPAKSVDIKTGVTGATVYFVADYDFTGLLVAGATPTFADGHLDNEDVKKDGVTLYKAVLSSGTVTMDAVTPEIA